jgi:hypothetical protein
VDAAVRYGATLVEVHESADATSALILREQKIISIPSSSLLFDVVVWRHVMMHVVVMYHTVVNIMMDDVMMNGDRFMIDLIFSERQCRRESNRHR